MSHGSGGLALTVTMAVLAAAVAHAAWNAIAHGITDKLVAFTLVCAGASICAAPLVLLARPPAVASWPYLGVSVLLHTLYNVLLMVAYGLGPFSQMYPIARGTSPLVVTLLAAVFLREAPTPVQLAGILVISVGLACLVLVGHRPTRAELPALAAALGTGLTIAAYTTVDGAGVRLSGGSAGYTAWLIMLEGLVIPVYALIRWRAPLLRRLRPVWLRGLLGGGLSLLAYGLVLWAQTRGALAPIAALRESSIILGAIIGTVLFHERFGRPRILATVLVAAGIVLLNL